MLVKNRFDVGSRYVFIIKSMGTQKFSGEFVGDNNGVLVFSHFSTYNGSEHFTVFGHEPEQSKAHLKQDEILGEIKI